MQNVEKVYMQSPQGDEIRHVDGTAAVLTPLMAAGWHQVPAPVSAAQHETAETKEAN
jgi:hypothetical protein